MFTLPGYRILDILIENTTWTLYKAYDLKDKKVVAIKQENKELKSIHDHAAIVHDFHVAKKLQTKQVLKPIKLEKHREESYFITDLFSGDTLEGRLQQQKAAFDLKTFLKLAIRITDAVGSVHLEHTIHKSLQPRNILLHHQTDEIILTGFHHSTNLSSEIGHPNVSPYQLKGRVAYMSPEQTGRMNRALDYRTDLYSLGIIFYEMITGILPFQLEHPAEMIHAHLARIPVRPSAINEAIPPMVSTIIMQLLEKMPESRYQSTRGLKEDLFKSLTEWNQTGEIRPFALSVKAQVKLFERPQVLYGREEAVKELVAGFHRVRSGKAELMLMKGPSGIGKTALVNELHKQLIKEKGYFISGKFVHLQKQIPFAPLIAAFQGLVRQVLSEGKESRRQWQDTLNAELGSSKNVIANFIPEICWLIGPQDQVSELPPEAVHNRFRLAIQKFVQVFARKGHPLVLFLDDLQWADEATLDLIDFLITNACNSYLLIVGAYRDNEVTLGHPFERMLRKVKEKEVPITTIAVTHLNKEHIRTWIEDALAITGKDGIFLIELIFRITDGNPFFIIQLLQTFNEEKVFYFHSIEGKWLVNVTRLKQLNISEKILDIILKRINQLAPETIATLQLASCFGNQFDLKSLAIITGKSFVALAADIWEGLETGLVLPMDESYKWVYPDENLVLLDKQPPTYLFLHDKVQQAFYSSMSRETQEMNHMKIGLQLVSQYDDHQREEHIFDIVNHLNHCTHHLSDEQKLDLAERNRLAGERAKQRAASESALHFFNIGKELLPADKWNAKYYETAFNIMIGLGEAEYLNQRFEEAERIFDELLEEARTNQEKLRIYNLKITLYVHIHEVERATNTGLEGLRLFNWNFKSNPNKLDVAKEYLLTKRALRQNKDIDLLELNTVSEDDLQFVMRTLINTNAPTYHWNQNLATILMLRALRLTLKHGDMDITSLVYNNYALTQSAGFSDYDASYQFGRLAIEHTEKFQDNSLKARVYFVFGSYVNHWKQSIRFNLDYLDRSQQLCIESGNLHLAGAAGMFIPLTEFIMGENIQDVKNEIIRQLEFATRNEYTLSYDFLGELMDWIDLLQAPNQKVNWNLPAFTDDDSAKIIHFTIRLQMTYLLDDELKAVEIMDVLDKLVDRTLKLINAPEYYFYSGLWIARQMYNGTISKKKGTAKIAKQLARLEKWANHAPMNYMHKYLLVKGELAKAKGKTDEAIQLYNQAIDLASENGFLQDLALANQCAAYFYLDQQLPKSAKSYLADAYHHYMEWGAERIAFRLYEKHKDLFSKWTTEDQPQGLKSAMERESLDMNAVFDASTAISEEVILNKLVDKLLRIAVINAGAEHGYLFLSDEAEELQLVAVNHMNEEANVTLYDHPEKIHENMDISLSVLDYVANTKQAVVLGEADRNGEFTKDAYVKKHHVKSILCLPIIYHRRLTGILYLENNQSTYVFTDESMTLLTLIASQAAISIENAYLYRNLEEKVMERTRLLNEANQNLLVANESLAESENNRSQLLSNISHDLRSPIATIRGYVDAILDGVVNSPEQRADYLQVIKKRLGSLNRLIQDLFDLAQFESGNVTFSMDIIPIDQLFNHLSSQFEQDIRQAGLTVRTLLPMHMEEAYPLVEVDVQRLEQVMSNLVSNAIKHTDQGGIEISLALEMDHGRAIISVADQGSGIPDSDLPYIFDRQYTKGFASNSQGHGLGLSISKEIITAHQGEIWVESEEGVGSRFSFSMNVFDTVTAGLELEADEVS
ncbi:hypothetical protein CWR48_14940 [Oceanobacillus arenosus]|uniref:histidine kinase n=1 Tax=Oceanobacillus arenosus TaxID=1229153 RepID=A0A3D8PP33_9BACI|nr:AAA family ATPase [Oceanobacillus arenosus]RDW16905.1 hypothetical protein CWR48_14940 [Oceanobacillus arenosus]